MKIIPWRNRTDESEAITRLRSELDRLFDEALTMPFGAWETKPLLPGVDRTRNGGWFPALDISDSDNELTLRLEVPGIEPKALNVSVTGRVLTVTGEKKEETERKGEDFYHRERRFGTFRRSIELPEAVDADRITAEYSNGVATIRVPKKASVKPRQVEVRPATATAKA